MQQHTHTHTDTHTHTHIYIYIRFMIIDIHRLVEVELIIIQHVIVCYSNNILYCIHAGTLLCFLCVWPICCVYIVWCMMYDVWGMMYDVWCMIESYHMYRICNTSYCIDMICVWPICCVYIESYHMYRICNTSYCIDMIRCRREIMAKYTNSHYQWGKVSRMTDHTIHGWEIKLLH